MKIFFTSQYTQIALCGKTKLANIALATLKDASIVILLETIFKLIIYSFGFINTYQAPQKVPLTHMQ